MGAYSRLCREDTEAILPGEATYLADGSSVVVQAMKSLHYIPGI